jgi:hypothetical protein
VGDALGLSARWALPLSGGLDSRLIACVGKDRGVNMRCFTYGPPKWGEVVHARRLAANLGLTWERVETGDRFLADYTGMWLDWFGAATHTHGMYQMPLLNRIEEGLPIATGFIGDPLGGLQIVSMAHVHERERRLLPVFLSKACRCPIDQLGNLLHFDCAQYIEDQEQQLQARYDEYPGVPWHKRWFLFQWTHVFGFSYYQPMMYDYWRGVSTPYMNREYANFCLSLPRCLLDSRHLQCLLLKQCWPRAAAAGCTAYGDELLSTGLDEVRRRILWRLPEWLADRFRPDERAGGFAIEEPALKGAGRAGLLPFDRDIPLPEFLKRDGVMDCVERAAAGEFSAYSKLRCLQPVVWRWLQDGELS